MNRNDPTSESYTALRDALLAMRGDSSSVMALLSSQSDGGAWWAETAQVELRRSLVRGRLAESEAIGSLIGLVLQIQQGGKNDEFSDSKLHTDSLVLVLDGTSAILDRNTTVGLKNLRQLTGGIQCHDSLQWVAWFWISRGAAEAGDLKEAQEAAQAALSLAGKLDEQAQSTSLWNLGELAFLAGDHQEARNYLSAAVELFGQLEDARGKAKATLAMARVFADVGQNEDAVATARAAADCDPGWSAPIVFLAEEALIVGDFDAASETVSGIDEAARKEPQVERLLKLIEQLADNLVPVGVVAEYLQARRKPATEDQAKYLEKLSRRSPEFLELRELLAWTLLKVGKVQQAERTFQGLSEHELQGELHSSVLLGLACIANRNSQHLEGGARLRATASAASWPRVEPTNTAESPFAEEDDGETFDLDIDDIEIALDEGFAEDQKTATGPLAPPPIDHLDTGDHPVAVAEPPGEDDFADFSDLTDHDSGPPVATPEDATAEDAATPEDVATAEKEATPEDMAPEDSSPALDSTTEVAPEDIEAAIEEQPVIDEDEIDEAFDDSFFAEDETSTGVPFPDKLDDPVEQPIADRETDIELVADAPIQDKETDQLPPGSFEDLNFLDDAGGGASASDTSQPAASSEMSGVARSVFNGSLALFAVPDLLDFLQSSRRTGALVITSEAGIGVVHLKSGYITGAVSPNCQGVGAALINEGVMTAEQLDGVASEQRANEPDRLFGVLLVEQGHATAEQVKDALTKQVYSAMRELVDWGQGRFAFEPDVQGPEIPSTIEIELSTQGVLLDVLREIDEENR